VSTPAQHAKAKKAEYHKKLESAKFKLRELAGENAEAAFQRVRQIQGDENTGWLAAYQKVTDEVRNAQKESK
jgi:hypothetical protein